MAKKKQAKVVARVHGLSAVFGGATPGVKKAFAAGQGSRVLGMIAAKYPTRTPASVLREALIRLDGNTSLAAKEFGISRVAFMSALSAVGLNAWLEETWPGRAKGGRPDLTPADVDPRVKAWVEAGGVPPRTGEHTMEIVRARLATHPPASFADIAARLGGSKQNARAAFTRTVWAIEEILAEQDAAKAPDSAS